MDNSPQPPKKRNEVEEWGGIFGITVIVVLLLAGSVYFAYMQYQKFQHNQQELQSPSNS